MNNNENSIAVIGAKGNMGSKRVQAIQQVKAKLVLNNILAYDTCQSSKYSKFVVPIHQISDVIDNENCPFVILSSPNSNERDQLLLTLLAQKKHVLVEKPISLKREVAEKAFQIAKAYHLSLKTGYNLEYFPGIQYARTKLSEIGDIKFIQAIYGNGWLNPQNDVKKSITKPEREFGVEYFMGCHMLSLLHLFCPNAKNVLSKNILKQQNFLRNFNDTAIISIQFEDLLFNSLVSWMYWKNTFSMKLLGMNGIIIIDGLVKYMKYGQSGESVVLIKRQKGLPKDEKIIFNDQNVDAKNIELECLDQEVYQWINAINRQSFCIDEEYEKNLFIYNCLESDIDQAKKYF